MIKISLFILFGFFLVGCGPNVKVIPQVKYKEKNHTLVQPMMSNGGKYMFPYHLNGERTIWIDAVIKELHPNNTLLSISINSLNTKNLFSNSELVEFISNIFTTNSIQKIQHSKILKETSSASFNSLVDMAKYLNVKYSQKEDFQYVLEALNVTYPEFISIYYKSKNQ
jgi:hypothetical protein